MLLKAVLDCAAIGYIAILTGETMKHLYFAEKANPWSCLEPAGTV